MKTKRKSTDSTRKFKKEYPYKYAYQTCKDNAKRRNIEFTWLFDEFRTWAIENSYLELKGKNLNDYGIDRIRRKEGYKKGNIQLLTNKENRIKEKKELWDERKELYYSNIPF